MTKRLLTLASVLVFAAWPRPAVAHGIGQRYDLPVPLWLYLFGAAAAVVLSFVLVGLFVGERTAGQRYPRFDLSRLRWANAVVVSRPLAIALQTMAVALFVLVLATGLFGAQSTTGNFAPTFVWVVWWVGLGFFTALVGNIWPLVNPWKILFERADALARRLGATEGIERLEPYPARLGAWPALALFGSFVWLENVFGGAPEPRTLAFAAIAYSIVTWGGMAIYGKHVWLRNGEAFSVFFAILGRFAPTEVRVLDREVCAECTAGCRELEECLSCEECGDWAGPGARTVAVRPWGVGLLQSAPVTPDRLAFVIFVLAAVTFDGLSATAAWQQLYLRIRPALGGPSFALFQTLGLVALPLVFLAVYRLAIRLTGLQGIARHAGAGRTGSEIAGLFVYSLVPIAFAYQVAHYATLFVGYGWTIVPLLSDPFAWGWDLFRTATWSIDPVLNAALVWYIQVALIVVGHVVAVYLAHVIARRAVRDPRAAVRSQLPLLVLMVAYTVSSLWILSQGTVSDSQLLSRPT